MWKSKGNHPNIQEGTYWIDNQIIKAFDHQGSICFLYRVKVDENLSVVISEHKDFKEHKDKTFQTWQQTTEQLSQRLDDLENDSIRLLQSQKDERRIIVLNSTGKDSVVTQHLAELAELNFEVYFNVTTLDVVESNRMAKEQGYKKIYPNTEKYGGFYQYIKRENIVPSRLNRFCCKYFKEDPTINSFDANEKILFLLGMRNDESNARSGYTDIWINNKWGNRDWVGILPIRKWTDLDVWLYIFREEIAFNPKYTYGYDRVGCGIACPNYTKTTWVLDQYYYPTMYQRWRDILKGDFVKNNKWIIMNCTIDEYVKGGWTGGVYRSEPTDEAIKEYADYSGLDIEVAAKYFNRYCMNGCKNKRGMPLKIKDKHTLAMNMKYHGRNIEKFVCKKCLMKSIGVDKDDWDKKVEDFERQGCALF